jgi:O-methyltransferase
MDLERLYLEIADYTLIDLERISSLWNLIKDIGRREVKGDIVECGCYKGGSSAILRLGMGSDRKLWIYDSFQGLPEPQAQDGPEAKNYVGDCAAAVEHVMEVLAATGASTEEYIIREGWFQNTFKQELPKQVSLLHCDADWYESVSLVLETFYPLIPKGGTIILDDFGHWEGCRIAFYEFCEKYSERPLLERVGYTQAFWVKGKEHNRNR